MRATAGTTEVSKAYVLLAFLMLALIVVSPAVASAATTSTTQRMYADVWNDGVLVVLVGDQYGTGWWVNQNYLVTAGHVVNYQTNSKVTLVKGDWVGTGLVVYVDGVHDIAVIKAESRPATQYVFSLAESLPDMGANIYVIGYPFELYKITGDIKTMSALPRATSGIISWIYPDKDLIEFSGATDAGNSGGPIVLQDGAVVGLVSFAIKGEVSSTYYGTDVNAIKTALKEAHVSYKVATLSGLGSASLGTYTINPWLTAVALGVGASAVTTLIMVPALRGRKK